MMAEEPRCRCGWGGHGGLCESDSRTTGYKLGTEEEEGGGGGGKKRD